MADHLHAPRHGCGGRSHYYMTGPDGTVSHGWFRHLAVVPFDRLELEGRFGDGTGVPDDSMPTMRMVFRFESTPTGSRFTSVTTFPTLEAMDQLLQMGMMEGMRSAMGQIDAVLADLASFAASRGTEAQLLSDTQVRVSRIIRGSAQQAWRAHHDAALMRRWLLGPDGWTMPVCGVATEVGQRFRYEWEKDDGSQARTCTT